MERLQHVVGAEHVGDDGAALGLEVVAVEVEDAARLLVVLDQLADDNRREVAHAGGGEVEHVRDRLDKTLDL
eukprot:5766815-Prymnesium_polylepis.1